MYRAQKNTDQLKLVHGAYCFFGEALYYFAFI